MFTEVFRELVLGNLEEEVMMYAVERERPEDAVEAYLLALYEEGAKRHLLVRGALISRLEAPPQKVDLVQWISEGQSGGDIALEIGHDLLQLVLALKDRDRPPSLTVAIAAEPIAVAVLDRIASDTEPEDFQAVASYLSGLLVAGLDVAPALPGG